MMNVTHRYFPIHRVLLYLLLSFIPLKGSDSTQYRKVPEKERPITGSLTGYVVDIGTAQPLVGANILIEDTELGAASDPKGHFNIPGVPVGSYTVRVEMMGYKPQARANVHIVPLRETVLRIALEVAILEGDVVVVTGRFFERARDAVVSARTVDAEEIRSDPAGAYDIQRMMEALPAVVLGSDQHNEIIVRGGGVGENLFIMDHLEIPNPNHFGEPGSSGGAINVINTDFIDRIDFYAGAFPARYGERLSSVMDISLREGNRQRFQSQVEASMAGFGAVTEGPLAKGHGSFLGSYRKSFLDLVIQDVGITAVPHFTNWQGKVVLDLGAVSKLIFNVLGGEDNIDLEGSTVPQTHGIDNVLADGNQFTGGMTLKTLLSANGNGLLSFGRNSSAMRYKLFNYLPDSSEQIIYDLDDVLSDWMLKGDLHYRFRSALELSVGFNHKWSRVNRNSVAGVDTLWTYRYGIRDQMPSRYVTDEEYYELIVNNPDHIIMRDDTYLLAREGIVIDSAYTYMKSSVYGQIKWHPVNRLEIVMGLRHYRVSANHAANWSPRLGISYVLSDRSNLNLAFGRHFQVPSYFQLFNNRKDLLRNMSTDQAVVGLEHLFAEDTRATLEIYYKRYNDLILEWAETTADTSDAYGGFANAGNGYSYGIELYLQKKFTRRWYGSFSYSRYLSLGEDPRNGFEGEFYSRSTDFRHLLTIVGGYKVKFMEMPSYIHLKQKPWWVLFAWLPILPADELEVSFRYRSVGGRPYTPKVYNATVRRWYHPTGQELNGERLPSYQRFDIMVLRRFYFRKMSLVTFVDIQNVFDRDNPWDIVYYPDGTKTTALQYRQFPVGGITLEF
ncbi:TonB-dependent receptor domain-containing protein [Candidatus Neomarinimicrobiota bacterium]